MFEVAMRIIIIIIISIELLLKLMMMMKNALQQNVEFDEEVKDISVDI